MKDSWQQIAAKLAAGDGKAACQQRAGTIEPVSARLLARPGSHPSYRDHQVDPELRLRAATR